jgi:inositol 1,4,5-triphosphate receptor type 1
MNKYMKNEVPKYAEDLAWRVQEVVEFFSWGKKQDGKKAPGEGRKGKGGSGGDDPNAPPQTAAESRRIPPPPELRRRSWGDWLVATVSVVVALVRFVKAWYFTMLNAASLAGFFVSPFFLVFHFT